MKLRCKMIDVAAMRNFMNVIHIVSRMSRSSVLRFSANEVCINVGDSRVPLIWVELNQQYFFSEYTMCGVSEEQNEIYLGCDLVMMARSLASLKTNAKSVKIKLTNKQQPCLTFEIELSSSSIESRQCMHDVPVAVIPRRKWTELQAPDIPEFHLSVELPQLKIVRNIVDRMKNLSQYLTVSADRDGTLVLSVENDSANVSTHFQTICVTRNSQPLEDETVKATVDIKKFLTFLAWDLVHPDRVKCNILNGKLLNLFFSLEDYLKIYYFVPAVQI